MAPEFNKFFVMVNENNGLLICFSVASMDSKEGFLCEF